MVMNVFKYHWVTCRKPHNCFGCGREFPTGTVMERQVINGTPTGIMTIHLCKTCEHLISEEFPYGGEYVQNSFYDKAIAYEALGNSNEQTN